MMKFSTNARFIVLKPESLEEAQELWAVCDRFRDRKILKAEPQNGGGMSVFIDLAATSEPCLFPEKP